MKQLLINRNEVIQGPSPKVLEVLQCFKSEHARFYIDGYYNSVLVPRISKLFNIPLEQVIVSYGEEDFFRILFGNFNSKTDSVLTQELHYTYYDKYLAGRNIPMHIFKLKEVGNDFLFDIKDCLKQYKKVRPKVLLLTSPNNPTGNSLSVEDLRVILKTISPQTLVVLDEAYWGFNPSYQQSKYLALLKKYPNLILLRSFSKLYSLAGLRIGFALCGKGVKQMLSYQNHYLGLSRILEEAAVAALESPVYYKKLAQKIIDDREWFIDKVKRLKNFKPFNSKANFVLLRLNNKVVKKLESRLGKEGVVIGKFVDADLVRVTVGCSGYTKNFVRLLEKIDR